MFLAVVFFLLIGRRIVRTLEVLNWILVATTLGGFLIMAADVRAGVGVAGGARRDRAASISASGPFEFFPAGADLVLLSSLVAFSGAGRRRPISSLSNWARDKGYGMGARAGYIPAAMGAESRSSPTAASALRLTTTRCGAGAAGGASSASISGAYSPCGALLGMLLPALFYVTFLPRGTDIQGLGISAALASAVDARAGALIGGAIAFLGAWILFKTQLDNFEGMSRAITDMLWTSSPWARTWSGGDVRAVYYTIMAILAAWGVFALRLAQPIVLLKISANVAGVIFIIASLHLLYINTTLLPAHVRPGPWRRAALVVMAVFYAIFVGLSLSTL